MIDKRRAQESQLKNLYNFIKKGSDDCQKAAWEVKSGKVIENKEHKKKFSLFQEQRKKFIDIRRRKLADLLIVEEEAFRAEIIAKQETPEQVRLKMEAKLKVLKDERERDRRELVKNLEERRFYESADELRKNDSEAFAFGCYLEQENQMLDKMKKREQEKLVEEVYVQLNNFENLKKIETEKLQAEEKRKKVNDTYSFLDWQKQTQELSAQKESELRQFEVSRLKEQWGKDLRNEEEEKWRTKENNKLVYRDIEEFNRREELDKFKRTEFEKYKDKERIAVILDKEKSLDEIDKKEKDKKISEFHQNKQYLEYVMNQKKEADIWMDKLAQIEADKQWQRTQEGWMKEEEMRIELLKQVYKEREQAVKYKKNAREDEKMQIITERNGLDNEINKYQFACAKIKEEEANRRKAHQEDLRNQMTDKEKMRQKEFQDKLFEEKAERLWEIEYQKKISDQRQLHLQKLEVIKKSGFI